MKTISLLAIVIGLTIHHLPSVHSAQPEPGKQVEQVFKTSDAAEVGYLLYLPENYKPGSALPVMLFLHGRGESDGPLSVVAKWGPPQLVARGEKLPYILVSPQCPKADNWSSATQQARLLELLDSMVEKFAANKDRIYLTGLSMGGSGSWRMAADHPERFAAVVPICGHWIALIRGSSHSSKYTRGANANVRASVIATSISRCISATNMAPPARSPTRHARRKQ